MFLRTSTSFKLARSTFTGYLEGKNDKMKFETWTKMEHAIKEHAGPHRHRGTGCTTSTYNLQAFYKTQGHSTAELLATNLDNNILTIFKNLDLENTKTLITTTPCRCRPRLKIHNPYVHLALKTAKLRKPGSCGLGTKRPHQFNIWTAFPTS